MLKKYFHSIVVAGFVLLSCSSATAEDLWSLYEPGCNSNGVDPDSCLCILDEITKTHGEKAARYVGLEMLMRSEEAAVIREAIGEKKAFSASSLFDIAQNKHCTAGRLARLKGTYTGSAADSATGAATGSSTDAASDMVGNQTTSSAKAAASLNLVKTDAPVFDLRNYPQGAVVDVKAALSEDMFKLSAGKNLRNFVGFYRIADVGGGVDTNGDSRANVYPGDEDYGRQVQIHGVSKKLYFSKDAGKSQYLGEVHLQGGALYVPYIRFQGHRKPVGLAGGFNFGADSKAMMDAMSKRMKNPSNLYFVYSAANPDNVAHLAHLGNSEFGFEDAPSDEAGQFDDIVLSFSFTAN